MNRVSRYQASFVEISKRWWFRLLLLVWTLIGTYDLVLSQIIPPDFSKNFPKMWQLGSLLPWWKWLLVFFVIVIIALIENLLRMKRATEGADILYAKGRKLTNIYELNEARPEDKSAFIKFRPYGDILNSHNISSITDIGHGRYGVNFSKCFPTDDIKAFVVGTPPKDFKFISVSRYGAEFAFDGSEKPIVSLKFEA